MSSIELQELSKRFGDVQAVCPTTLRVESGELVTLLGELILQVNPAITAIASVMIFVSIALMLIMVRVNQIRSRRSKIPLQTI